jgi:hypothetical protein
MLEMAQSDTILAKRGASLEFFRQFYQESHKTASWLDSTTPAGIQAGPYGPGGTTSTSITPALRAILKRRQQVRLAREGEILRYWVQASIACLQPGAFTNDERDGAIASRGILAASASLRPALAHIATRIKDADDRGASRLYVPVMKMLESVLKKLFLSATSTEAVRSACIKFLEIVCLCCSRKPQDLSRKRSRDVSI